MDRLGCERFKKTHHQKKNNKDFVLVALEEYNSQKETRYLLSGKNREVLIQSLKEAKEGKMLQDPII